MSELPQIPGAQPSKVVQFPSIKMHRSFWSVGISLMLLGGCTFGLGLITGLMLKSKWSESTIHKERQNSHINFHQMIGIMASLERDGLSIGSMHKAIKENTGGTVTEPITQNHIIQHQQPQQQIQQAQQQFERKNYVVKLGIFTNESQANSFKSYLKQKGVDSHVIQSDDGFSVQTSAVDSAEHADSQREYLFNSRGIAGVVAPIN